MCTVFSSESVGDSEMNQTLALMLWSLSFNKEMMHTCNINTDTSNRRSRAVKFRGGSSNFCRGEGN